MDNKKYPTREEMLKYVKPDMTFDEMLCELGQVFGLPWSEVMCVAFKEKLSPLDVMSDMQKELYFLEKEANDSSLDITKGPYILSEYEANLHTSYQKMFKRILSILKNMNRQISDLENYINRDIS